MGELEKAELMKMKGVKRVKGNTKKRITIIFR